MSKLREELKPALSLESDDPEYDEPHFELAQTRPRRRTFARNELLQPFLKWAGGKRQLLSQLREQVPAKYGTYFEPFLGAGAMLLDLQPQKARITDANKELINCYKVIKDTPAGLLQHIRKHHNTEEYFYELRSLDRKPEFKTLTPIERASRIIFLNKTCYNGLFRVNSRGHFNVPFGNYQKPQIVDEIVIQAISNYLNTRDITIKPEDFETACTHARANDFIYLDPPYDPVSDTASFTGYNFDKFDRNEQRRLKEVFVDLTRRRCKVLLSNSATDFIRDLYAEYTIIEVEANRAINSVGTGRGKVCELLIRNYDL